MNNTKIMTSLDDTDELRKVILDNPELPIIIFAGEESYCGEYAYNLAEIRTVKIKELTMLDEIYVDKDDFRDRLNDRLAATYETEEKLSHAIDNVIKETEFLKAIVIYVG